MNGKPFKRKFYDEMLEWKNSSGKTSALMIDGARRIGKSTIAEVFAKNEYDDYLIIDFAIASEEIKENFNNIGKMNVFFRNLFLFSGKELKTENSVIIFDEVQMFPKAREAIKYLIKDGRYIYIETGSLISIKKKSQQILIPSEEDKRQMFPMDFEEFLYANGVGDVAIAAMKDSFTNGQSLSDAMHNKILDLFKKYLLVGGLFNSSHTFVMLLSFPIKALYTPIPNNLTSKGSDLALLSEQIRIIGISFPLSFVASSLILSNFSKINLSIVS